MNTVTKEKVILVEGKDEVQFFNALLKHLNIIDEISVEDYQGKDKLKDFIPAYINRSGFENVRSIAIIRDADNNFDGAFKSICGVLRKNGQKYPQTNAEFSLDEPTPLYPRFGIYVMPGNHEAGMLEDLCLQTQKNHPIMEYTDAYIETATTILDKPPKNPAKARCQTFLAAMHEIASSVGVASQKGYWNFDHECMAELTNFLRQL